MRLVWQYAKLGALWPAVKAGVRCLVKGQSFKGTYPEVLKKVEPFLVERYGTRIPQIAQEIKANTNCTNDTNEIPHHVRNEEQRTIWWCWLQGIENAPEIVKACYNSLLREFKGSRVQEVQKVAGHARDEGYEIKVIDAKNWREYVEFPVYIVEKWERGRIPAAMFSDLLRVELLIKYGGTWIDSTVLCTGGSRFMVQGSKLMDAPLFVFQYTKEGSVPVSISNWFITACRNNEVLRVLREMLYAYWRDYDCVLDYYIFHLFFAMISKEYKEQILAMPFAQSQRSLVLLHHWGEKFDQRKWDRLTSEVCFHKLAFRVSDKVKNNKDNYYNYILEHESSGLHK